MLAEMLSTSAKEREDARRIALTIALITTVEEQLINRFNDLCSKRVALEQDLETRLIRLGFSSEDQALFSRAARNDLPYNLVGKILDYAPASGVIYTPKSRETLAELSTPAITDGKAEGIYAKTPE